MDRHLRPVRQFEAMSRRDALSRRDFLRVAAGAGAGAVLLGACRSDDTGGSPTTTPGIVVDPPPETTTVRLVRNLATCTAPIYLAELFLPAEGFTDVQYVDDTNGDHGAQQTAAGDIDISLSITSSLTTAADRGDRLVLLAGIHPTCFELFAGDRVQSLRDLKGKTIWVWKVDATDPSYVFVATLLAYVGIDLQNEVEFASIARSIEEFTFGDRLEELKTGTLDAMILAPPFSGQLRASNIGHVVLNGMMDAPWSQYFCCIATGNRDFVEKNPATTKRALRAILKATDLCAREPARAARYLVDKGLASNYEDTLDTITGLSYGAWRELNPEDSVRFFALRLKEAGLVTSTPEALISRATDWRYLDEIKRELAV